MPILTHHPKARSLGPWLLVAGMLACSTATPARDGGGIPVDVCHQPPGNPANARVVTVGSEAALAAHLGHGDVLFGAGLGADCAGARVSFRVDPGIEPTAPTAPGFRGGPPRPLGVIQGAGGGRNEYIANEVLVRPATGAALQAFLARYGGKVLADDTVLIGTEGGGTQEVPGGAEGAHVVEVDPAASPLLDLPGNALAAGLSGALAFSSDAALRLLALQLREQGVHASLNVALYPDSLLEHPDDNGFNIDFSVRWWMRDDDNGPSTGVARAIRYLRHTGLPPAAGVWTPARVAIIDGGFNLDPETGLGSPDYFDPFTPPLQVDAVDYDGRAGGSQGGWHGEMVFGVCCAYPRNGFGSAGTGGDLIRPIAIRATTTVAGQPFFFSSDVHYAIYAAWLMGADVINMSLGCNRDWTGETGPLCDLNALTGGNLQSAVFTGVVDGGVVVAGAGNGDDNDISDDDVWPCELDAVICAGGIRLSGENAFNWGDGVDISAPGVLLKTTVTPASAALDADDVGFDELADFSGTSAAAPFVSGVAALLKAVDLDDPGLTLRWDDVEAILQETANCAQSPSPCPQEPRDPHVVKGYVDALRAVQLVRANPPPTAQINFLSTGDSRSWARPVEFLALLSDPPSPWGFVGSVRFSSSLDGEICTAEGAADVLFCTATLPTLGRHAITLVATDEFGADSAPDTVEIDVVNAPPVVTLLSPEDQSERSADQLVVLRADVHDSDFEDYDLPCPQPGGACVQWTSDIDGDITPADPPVLDFARTLSIGTHLIRLEATDGKGETASETATVTVLAGAGLPTARILSAGEGADGRSTVLIGEGTDPEDGDLVGASLIWRSDVDGPLGTGPAIEVELSDGGCESRVDHTVTLEAVDADGNADVDSIVIPIIVVC